MRIIYVGFSMQTIIFFVKLFCCCTTLPCFRFVGGVLLLFYCDIALWWAIYTIQRITIIIIDNFILINGIGTLVFGIIFTFLDLCHMFLVFELVLVVDLIPVSDIGSYKITIFSSKWSVNCSVCKFEF